MPINDILVKKRIKILFQRTLSLFPSNHRWDFLSIYPRFPMEIFCLGQQYGAKIQVRGGIGKLAITQDNRPIY